MRIEVTATDIAQGVPQDCDRCPVALAVRRATGKECEVEVSRIRFELEDGEYIRIPTPEEAASFILEFDDEDTRPGLTPFAFELPVPFEVPL